MSNKQEFSFANALLIYQQRYNTLKRQFVQKRKLYIL